jgi:hypothetical protein
MSDQLLRHSKRLSVSFLVVAMALLFFVRVLLYPDVGIEVRVVLGLLWLVALALIVKLIVSLIADRWRWEYLFLLTALLAIVVSGVLGKETVGPVTFIVFLASALGLAVLWIRRRRRPAG